MNNRIAVFTNGFSNEFIEHVVTGIQKKAAADGVDLFVFVTYCAAYDSDLQNKCQLNIFHLPDPATFDGAIMLTNRQRTTTASGILPFIWSSTTKPRRSSTLTVSPVTRRII